MIDFSKIENYRENNRIEAKKAVGGLPHSIWETYSAFANTLGGIILLGVEEKEDKSFETVHLPDATWLVEEFWRILNNPNKVSANILSEKDVTVEEIDGKKIVAIRIPRARKWQKPVYIDGNMLTGCYLRNGEGDYRCTAEEIRKMKRDAEESAETAVYKQKTVEYLTRNISASKKELSKILSLSLPNTEKILTEMVEEDILKREKAGRKIIYKLDE